MAQSIPTFNDVFDLFLNPDPSNFFGDQPKTITFTIVTAGTIDPVTGDRTGGSTDIYSAEGFRRAVKKEEFSGIVAGDLVFTCKQSDLVYTPKINDKATIDGVEYTVIDLEDKGQVAWGLQIRG